MTSAVHMAQRGILGDVPYNRQDHRKYVLVAIKDVDKHSGCNLVTPMRPDICKDQQNPDGRTHYHRCAVRYGFDAAKEWVDYYNKLGWTVKVMDRVQ